MRGREKKSPNPCTFCTDGSTCKPGKIAHACAVDLYSHCAATEAPTLAPSAMVIHVVDLEFNKFTFDVSPGDVIGQIKQRVSLKNGYEVEDINLRDAAEKDVGGDFTSLDDNQIVRTTTRCTCTTTSTLFLAMVQPIRLM